jgi:hypothetical protein
MPASGTARALFRRIPGLVRTKRLLLAACRGIQPLRPPVESPALVAKMLVRPPDDDLITGNGFAARCRHVVNYDVPIVNDEVDDSRWWFCNPEFLEYFFREVAPDDEYVLFTHNSNVDRPIDQTFARKLEQPELVAWFATNVELRHPKLHSIPIGVGNPIKCDPRAFRTVKEALLEKSELFEASFSIDTNPAERRYCIEQTGVVPAAKQSTQRAFYERLASAYFCISPNGNGVDCYRTWQALYLRTIPIVTRSVLTDQHPDLPWIVLDDWSQFRNVEFTPELYERTLGAWDPDSYSLDHYLERVRETIRELRRRAVIPAATDRRRVGVRPSGRRL